jgi:hypothetical protein
VQYLAQICERAHTIIRNGESQTVWCLLDPKLNLAGARVLDGVVQYLGEGILQDRMRGFGQCAHGTARARYFAIDAIFCNDRARITPHEGQAAAVVVAHRASRSTADQDTVIDQAG